MIETNKMRPIKTESKWKKVQNRFEDYDNGFVDSYSILYNNRNCASEISIDEIAENWQEPRNYFSLRIIEGTYSYLGYALCSDRINFKKYLSLLNGIVLSDNDTTYSVCIRILMEARYA